MKSAKRLNRGITYLREDKTRLHDEVVTLTVLIEEKKAQLHDLMRLIREAERRLERISYE